MPTKKKTIKIKIERCHHFRVQFALGTDEGFPVLRPEEVSLHPRSSFHRVNSHNIPGAICKSCRTRLPAGLFFTRPNFSMTVMKLLHVA
jgi:hypothetical protein